MGGGVPDDINNNESIYNSMGIKKLGCKIVCNCNTIKISINRAIIEQSAPQDLSIIIICIRT